MTLFLSAVGSGKNFVLGSENLVGTVSGLGRVTRIPLVFVWNVVLVARMMLFGITCELLISTIRLWSPPLALLGRRGRGRRCSYPVLRVRGSTCGLL